MSNINNNHVPVYLQLQGAYSQSAEDIPAEVHALHNQDQYHRTDEPQDFNHPSFMTEQDIKDKLDNIVSSSKSIEEVMQRIQDLNDYAGNTVEGGRASFVCNDFLPAAYYYFRILRK